MFECLVSCIFDPNRDNDTVISLTSSRSTPGGQSPGKAASDVLTRMTGREINP